jgi:hypothetical protein
VTVGIEEIEEAQKSAALQDPQVPQGEARVRGGQRGGGAEVIAINSSKSSDVWTLYLYAMKSPMTREKYQRRFIKFLDFLGLAYDDDTPLPQKSNTFAQKAREDTNWAFENILKFIQYQNDRVNKKEIAGATVRNYVKSIKLFCEMADIPIPWKKITRGLPRGRRYADDRIPTIEELRKLLDYPDRRMKAIICTMTSSGIRLGAWDYLRWGHIRPIEREGKVIAAKIIAYSGEDEEYFSYISPEAWQALKDWMRYREESGELINEDSWLMRDLWDTTVPQGRGLATKPKKLASLGIKRLIERAIWAQGLRKKLENGKKRHPYQGSHSMRKWFKTRCEIDGMKPINIEKLMGHSVGISDSYYRATENEMLEDYLLAIDHLAITNDYSLKTQIAEISKQRNDNDLLIKAKLSERELEIQSLSKKYDSDIALLKEAISDMQQLLRDPKGLVKVSREEKVCSS